MAKPQRFSTTALVITTMVVLSITAALVIWLPTPEERARKRESEAFSRAFAELSSVRIGPIRWMGLTLEQAVADVNAQLEKKGETELRLFVSKDYAPMTSSTISMDLEGLPVAECARYMGELTFASMSGSREGITFGPMRCDIPMGDLSWRIRARRWMQHNLWERWTVNPGGADPFAPWGTPAAPSPATSPGAAPGAAPAPYSGADPFAPGPPP